MAKKQELGNIKPTGINEALDKDIPKEEFSGMVVCRNCGKDVDFVKGTTVHLKCPRCGKPLERDLSAENRHAKKVINYAFLLKFKKYFLYLAFLCTAGSLAYNIIGYFTGLFTNGSWWLALMSIPFVAGSVLLTSFYKFKSQSFWVRFFSWLTLVLNLIAIVAIVVTAVPYLNNWVADNLL